VIDGDSDHDRGYDLMTADDRWTWVRPAELVRTQCGSFSNDVLDFVFVNDPVANGWNPISTIAQNSPAFCDFGGIGNSSTDDAEMSDHKPVWATLYPPPLE
jgi:hypothetical protein